MKKRMTLLLALAMLLGALSLQAAAADAAQFSVQTVCGDPGDTVEVRVLVENNPGIVSMKLMVGYNPAALELTAIREEDFAGVTFGPLTAAPIAVNWVDAVHPDNRTSGTAAVLTFRIREQAALGTTAVTVSFDADDVYDSNFENVPFTAANGGVEIVHRSHTWGDWQTVQAAACLQPGTERRTCTACGEQETRETAPGRHSWEADVCSVCGAVREHDHAWDEGTVTRQPTCTASGELTRHCTVCAAVNRQELAPLGHTWGDWDTARAASCTQTGLQIRSCSCGGQETEELPMVSHAYADGFCTGCGREKPAGTLKKNEAGTLCYYVDGQQDTEYFGFIDFGGGRFLVKNGCVVSSRTGLTQDPADHTVWYYLSHGQVQLQHTGLTQYDGEWFYVENGRLDTTVSTVVEYDGGLFYVAKGRLVRTLTGLAQDPVTRCWYYFSHGQVQTQYTGLVRYDGQWFYVERGEFIRTFRGEVEYKGSLFLVKNGTVVQEIR